MMKWKTVSVVCWAALAVWVAWRVSKALPSIVGQSKQALSSREQPQAQSHVPSSDEIPDLNLIRLNVGGVQYQTTKQTLKKVPGSLLERMFVDGSFSPARVGNGESFFIGRSGPGFAHILDFLRDGELPPRSLPLAEAEVLKREAVYFGIGELEAWAMERLRDRRFTAQALKTWVNIALNSGNELSCKVDLSQMDASGMDLKGFSTICRIEARGTNFQGANLEGVVLSGNFAKADFDGANMKGAIFFRSYFDDLAGADLQGALFEESYFASGTFQGANIKGAAFEKGGFLTEKQVAQLEAARMNAFQDTSSARNRDCWRDALLRFRNPDGMFLARGATSFEGAVGHFTPFGSRGPVSYKSVKDSGYQTVRCF